MAPNDSDSLDRLRIASPCQRKWEGMAGDDRLRHCTLCDRDVYNLAEMTRDEIGRVLAAGDDGACVRLTRRSDGTLRTRDDPPAAPARWSRAGRAAGAMLLSAVALASGCASAGKPRSSEVLLSLQLLGETASEIATEDATFVGVARSEGNPVPGLTVTLRDEGTGEEWTAVTDLNGSFRISGLRAGLYLATAKMAGFESAALPHVALKAGAVTRASATVRIDTGETITVGAAGPDPLSVHEISTTFTQDLINKLPI